MHTVKEVKRQYIRSKISLIVVLILFFILLCVIGKIINNYVIIGGAVIYAFISYIVFYNKMMTYVEKKNSNEK